MGGTAVTVDFAPFTEAQAILYDGPWIAERALSLDAVLARHRDALHPVTRAILEGAGAFTAVEAFGAIHQIAELRAQTRPLWRDVTALVVPTTPTIYTKAEVAADPITLNSRLGIYTNFVNLLGLCGVAVPNGFRADGLPQGITFLGAGFAEAGVAGLAGAFHQPTRDE